MSLPDRRHSKARYKLVIFDMDGTLTEELIDFDAIRSEIGAAARRGLLEHIAQLPSEEKRAAEEILHRHEIAAAEQCKLHAGATEALARLAARGIHTALLTRNSSACATRIVTRHGLKLEYIATREHLPHKPHADSILNITRHFAILPEQTLMVGDYLYDLQAARNAGVDSALICHQPGPLPEFATMATYVVRSLAELAELVIGE